MTRRTIVAAATGFGAAAMLVGSSAAADTLKAGDERFKFIAGWFLPAFNTDVRLDGETGQGDDVSLGDDLGLDEDQSGALFGFEWRFAERHRLSANWSQFSQNATRVIDREISIGDEIFPVDAEVRTDWSIDLIPITYSYSFIKDGRNELAGTFGIHWDRISMGFRGSSSLSPGDVEASTDHSADLPLPLFGLRYDHHFSDSWSAGVAASYFTIEFGSSTLDADGSLYNGRAYAEYRFQGRYGAGLALDYFKLDVEASKSRLQGEYIYDYWGPVLYLTARF
jgi:hypothetical protein